MKTSWKKVAAEKVDQIIELTANINPISDLVIKNYLLRINTWII